MAASGADPPAIDQLKGEYTEAEFEKKYVHEVYEEIAGHFSSTRYKV